MFALPVTCGLTPELSRLAMQSEVKRNGVLTGRAEVTCYIRILLYGIKLV